MTTERPDSGSSNEHNPATDPDSRRNGQGRHHGVPHSPEEFDALNPEKPKSDQQKHP